MKGLTLFLLRGVNLFMLLSLSYCIVHGIYGFLFFSQRLDRMDSIYGAGTYAVSLCVYLAMVRAGQRVFAWTVNAH